MVLFFWEVIGFDMAAEDVCTHCGGAKAAKECVQYIPVLRCHSLAPKSDFRHFIEQTIKSDKVRQMTKWSCGYILQTYCSGFDGFKRKNKIRGKQKCG